MTKPKAKPAPTPSQEHRCTNCNEKGHNARTCEKFSNEEDRSKHIAFIRRLLQREKKA